MTSINANVSSNYLNTLPPQQRAAAQKAIAYQMARMGISEPQDDAQTGIASPTGDSFTSAVVGGAAITGLMHSPKIIHPFSSIEAAKSARDTYNAIAAGNEIVAGLPKVQQGQIVSQFFNAERLSAKNLFSEAVSAARGAGETAQLQGLYNAAMGNYKAAVATGNPQLIAKYGAELDTILAAGKKPGMFSRAMGFLTGNPAQFKPVSEIAQAVPEAAATAKQVAGGAEMAAAAGSTAKAALSTLPAAAPEAVSTLGKAGQWVKGALKSGGFKTFALFSGAIELFTNVIPAFAEKGIWGGIKETAGSAVNVLADAGGFCVGAKAGASGGAAIGSFFGPIGTAIGGAIGGLLGGFIGAWGARKCSKLVTGKSFSEEKAEQQQQMAQANANPFVRIA